MTSAIIDLGTNTFHLLIVKIQNGQFTTITRKRIFVQLAEEGIQTIAPIPYQRGINALSSFKNLIIKHKADTTIACGTSALREASNSLTFRQEAKSLFDIDIRVINGHLEAEYIFLGNRLATKHYDKPYLIMDIGGGSVEFIIGHKGKCLWKHSFNIGMAVLYEKFIKNDKISNTTEQEVFEYLDDILSPLKNTLVKHPVQAIIGSAGTFELVMNLSNVISETTYCKLNFSEFELIHKRYTYSTLKTRIDDPNIPKERTKLTPLGLLLMSYIQKVSKAEDFLISHYSMKEGIIAKHLL